MVLGNQHCSKIIAGLEQIVSRQKLFSPGYSIGYLEQDPKLDSSKTVKEIVQEGVQEVIDILNEYKKLIGATNCLRCTRILKRWKMMNRQAELQEKIDQTDAWNIDNKLERAMDALRCPDGDTNVAHLSGR